jgi:hypothetical protein
MHQRSESQQQSLRAPDTFLTTFQFLLSISSYVPVYQCSLGAHTQMSSEARYLGNETGM